MKKIFFIGLATCLFWGGCNEVNDLVQLNAPTSDVLSLDSTYNNPSLVTQQKNVLIEDFTGDMCDNCPNAQKQGVAIEDANPGRVSVIGIHCTSLADPYPGYPDYRTTNGTHLVSYLFGISGPSSLPIGDIDRQMENVTSTASIQVPYALWSFYVDDSELTKSPIANIVFTSKTYDSASRTLNMEITASFNQSSSNTYYMSAAVIENGFKGPQETTTLVDSNFTFEHVLRKLMNPYNGLQIASAPAKGASYIVKLTTILDPSWNPDSCNVVAFVHQRSTTSNAVEQVQQTTVK